MYFQTQLTPARAAVASAMLKTVYHPDRLRILSQLLQGEHRVGELAAFLALRPSTVSQQLAFLRRGGAVRVRRAGHNMLYGIASPELRAIVISLLAHYAPAPASAAKPKKEPQKMPNSAAPVFVLRDFSAGELRDALARREVVLIDVRELGEHQQARIDGALLHPLSGFDPHILPPGALVLHCAAGKRSRMAAELCAKAGVPVAGHLAGGITAWMQAGLPVARG